VIHVDTAKKRRAAVCLALSDKNVLLLGVKNSMPATVQKAMPVASITGLVLEIGSAITIKSSSSSSSSSSSPSSA
jgi:hypothetical protein